MGFISFFPNYQPRGQTPQPIFTQNGLVNAQGRTFCSKNRNFFEPLATIRLKRGKFGKFSDRKFRSKIAQIFLRI